jgi:hypothetical protein
MNTTPVPAEAGLSVILTGVPVWRPMPSQEMLVLIVRWDLIIMLPFFSYEQLQ